MDELERQVIGLTMLIRKAEDWSTEYTKDPKTHVKLLRAEATLQVKLVKYFRDIAANISKYIHWQSYLNQRPQVPNSTNPDFNVEVVVKDVPLEEYDGTFIKVVFNDIATLSAIGATAGENIYRIPLGIQSTDAIIQQLTTEHVASLVGKKVLKDGSIVDNPKATYRISDKTRTDIAQSIKTSLNMGDDIQTATERLKKTVMGLNNNRAKIIAQTESVNAYQSGLMEFAKQSGAVGKESQDVGAVDNCRTYAELGPVPIDYLYDGTYLRPTYHVRCLVGGTLVSNTGVNATSKRFYKGSVVTIRTARGNELTVTPNHPILTAQGWIGAGELRKGMNLLSCLDGERITSTINPNNHNVPTKIENVIETFERTRKVITRTVPTTTEDFHGDGIDGQVAVINTDSLLGSRIGAESTLEPFGKEQLSRTCMATSQFTGLSSLHFLFKSMHVVACRFIGSLSPKLSLFRGTLGNVEAVSDGLVPELDPTLDQPTCDSAPIGAKRFSNLVDRLAAFIPRHDATNVEASTSRASTGETALSDGYASLTEDGLDADMAGTHLGEKLLDSFSGNVALDNIVSIEWSWFAGHVYNIETNTGWYIGNNIITHNCRCGVRYIYQAEWDNIQSNQGN